MKKHIFIAAVLICTIIHAGTANAQEYQGKKILVAYYSRSGNTKKIATQIQDLTHSDIFRIETAIPYPEDFDEMVKKASEEKKSGFLPPLKSKVSDIESYDTIFVGFPIWDMSLPSPIKSFLSGYDLKGKIIIPFCTNDGYGKGSSFNTVESLCPSSKFMNGFAIEGKKAETASSDILKWLKELKFL